MSKNENQKETPLDLLMFVGGSHYTVESYVEEAHRMGACKRFGGHLPSDIDIGVSKIFLCHDISEEQVGKLKIDSTKSHEYSQVFAYFTINGILVVGDAELIAEKEGINLQRIDEQEISMFDERGCGFLKIGGSYFVSEEDMKKLAAHADGVSGSINVLEEPIIIHYSRFRGYKYVIGRDLLDGDFESAISVDAIRSNNASVRRALSKEEPKKSKRGRPKKKKPSFKSTIIELIYPYRGEVIDLDELITKAIKENPPISTYARRVYRNVITLLSKDDILTIVKDDSGTQLVNVEMFELEADDQEDEQ